MVLKIDSIPEPENIASLSLKKLRKYGTDEKFKILIGVSKIG